ncbi:metal-dependent hydrolase [Pedosphaera parvula]|uniref:Membrane-bound metal-dependent hydrolase n=1 Tax=Pedosphaera parvula (strain Ellin514) TaxID=320771 RepID=B9XNA9_PEDPL|nr:metal-dependent hydrolase [Pedosphaera parvula]EEF58662.1 membrane-bound metal-dependent hydrolase [Pedosphaera parvula Ellin514]
MDILTHAAIGFIAASPFAANSPELAGGIVLGSVLPDLDTFSRVFGKRAFLKWHQTWTHSMPLALGLSAILAVCSASVGWNGVQLGMGIFVGMLGHILLDYSNTLGIALLKPFSHRRFCLEWVFFIDATVLIVTLLTTAVILWNWNQGQLENYRASLACGIFLIVYWLVKGALRNRAGRLAPAGTISLLPSAFIPWKFLGAKIEGVQASLFHLNAFTGATQPKPSVPIHDATFKSMLAQLPEFKMMQELSPAYHVVDVATEGTGKRLLCRDLRTRNFSTSFGDLTVWLNDTNQITKVHFHV